MLPDGPLIDDRVGESSHLEQRRDAAHGFGVPQADEAAGQQVLEEILRRDAARRIVEIDQHVAAEDHVELAVGPGLVHAPRCSPRKTAPSCAGRRGSASSPRPAARSTSRPDAAESRISARLPNMPARAASSTAVSMSEPMISMSYSSTSGQFSSSHMAIEYGSSPVEQGTDQMRMESPFFLCRSRSVSRSVVRQWSWWSSR